MQHPDPSLEQVLKYSGPGATISRVLDFAWSMVLPRPILYNIMLETVNESGR